MATKAGRVRASLTALAVAFAAAALFAPVGQTGSCPTGGECVIRTTNLLMIPTRWLWIPVAIIAALIAWWIQRRRAAHQERQPLSEPRS